MLRLDGECLAMIERATADLQDAEPKLSVILRARLYVLNKLRADLEPHLTGWPASAQVEQADEELEVA
jgi:hypothetical protein